jgi:hypothetical protein
MFNKLTTVVVRFTGNISFNEVRKSNGKQYLDWLATYLIRRNYGRNISSHTLDRECIIAHIVRTKGETIH